MAIDIFSQCSTVNPETLRVQTGMEWWGKTYRGTPEQLIDAALVEVKHLPGIGNERRSSASFAGELLVSRGGAGKVITMRVKRLPGKSNRFEVYIPRPRSAYDDFIERCLEPVPGLDMTSGGWWISAAKHHWKAACGARVNAMPEGLK